MPQKKSRSIEGRCGLTNKYNQRVGENVPDAATEKSQTRTRKIGENEAMHGQQMLLTRGSNDLLLVNPLTQLADFLTGI